RARAAHAALAVALRALVLHDLPFAVAAIAGRHVDELAEDGLLDAADLAGAAAGWAAHGRLARLGAVAAADQAGLPAGDFQFFLAAEDSLLEGQVQSRTQVGAPLWPAPRGRAAEEAFEEIADVSKGEPLD